MSGLFNHFVSWLYTRRLYGPRCPDFMHGCACCEAWKVHDELFNEAEADE